MEYQRWIPSISQDWELVPLDTYKFIFERGEEKFEEIISDSELITDRSIKLFYALIIFLSGIMGATVKTYGLVPLEYVWLLAVAYILNISVLMWLIFGRKMVSRGSQPKDIFCDNIIDKFKTEENAKSIIYYHEIIRLQEGININRVINRTRQKVYAFCFVFSAINFIATGVMTIWICYHP